MSDFFAADSSLATNAAEYTVSEISGIRVEIAATFRTLSGGIAVCRSSDRIMRSVSSFVCRCLTPQMSKRPAAPTAVANSEIDPFKIAWR